MATHAPQKELNKKKKRKSEEVRDVDHINTLCNIVIKLASHMSLLGQMKCEPYRDRKIPLFLQNPTGRKCKGEKSVISCGAKRS